MFESYTHFPRLFKNTFSVLQWGQGYLDPVHISKNPVKGLIHARPRAGIQACLTMFPPGLCLLSSFLEVGKQNGKPPPFNKY